MKLTNSELKLVKNIDQIRKQKIKRLVGVAAVLVVYWVLRYVDVLRVVEIPVDSLLIIYLAILAGEAFSNVRPESRYVELLRRYVNNDADTIEALSKRK